MSQDNEGALGEDFPSPKEMREWAQREIQNLSKANELRLRELNELVIAYERGRLTAEEADDRQSRYCHRWDEALPGIGTIGTMTDEEILAAIDVGRSKYLSPKTIRERCERLHGKRTQWKETLR